MKDDDAKEIEKIKTDYIQHMEGGGNKTERPEIVGGEKWHLHHPRSWKTPSKSRAQPSDCCSPWTSSPVFSGLSDHWGS